MEKTVFMNSVSVLDCAVLLDGEGPRGRSWFVDLKLQGTTDSDGILVDFGSARRIAKGTIDAGLDHRLLVRETTVSPIDAGRFLVTAPWNAGDGKGQFVLNSYRGSLAFFSKESLPKADAPTFEEAVARRIEGLLRAELPERVTTIQVALRNPEAGGSRHYTYTHSLRQHCGNCQRFHGHGNAIEIHRDGLIDNHAAEQAARALDGCYFVASDYVIEKPTGSLFEPILAALEKSGAPLSQQAFVQYRGSQGDIALTLPRAALRTVPGESTVENLADFIKRDVLCDTGVTVTAFEGLQKGALSS